MAFLTFRWKTKLNYTPASYTADETATVLLVNAGDMGFGICITRTRVVFNGGGTDAIIIVGDGDDTDGYLANGNMDETTVGLYRGAGAYWGTAPKLYTVTDTIDIGFTANTSGTRTTGAIDLAVAVSRVNPI